KTPVIADGLGDGQDVRFGEGALRRRAPVAAGAEADQLVRVLHIGPALEILAFEPGHINQHLFRCRLACKGRDRHDVIPFPFWCVLTLTTRHSPLTTHPPHATGHGSMFQMDSAYSAMVRSLENWPEPATLL